MRVEKKTYNKKSVPSCGQSINNKTREVNMSLPKRLITPVWVGQIVVSVVESIRNTGSILHCIGEDLMGVARGADKSGDLLPGDLDDLMALRKSANVAVELLDEQYSALYNCLNAYDKKKKECYWFWCCSS